MKHLKFLFIAVVFLMSASVNAQYKIFKFPMTKMSVYQNSQQLPTGKYESTIAVVIDLKGTTCMIADGDYKLSEFKGDSWSINSVGALEIGKDIKHKFVITNKTQSMTLMTENAIMMYKEPKSSATFAQSYNDLYNFLKSVGKIKGVPSGSSSASSSNQQSTQSSSQSAGQSSAQSSSQNMTGGPANPPAKLNGAALDLEKMCVSPFGIKPANGKRYTVTDINRAAKSVWGWDLQLDYKTKTAGYKWTKLDGMVFMSFPIYRIFAYDYSGGEFVSDFYCELIIPDNVSTKRKLDGEISAYFKSRGWNQASSTGSDRPCFYKDNVIVECYAEKSNLFSGKLEYTINAQSFPNASVVRNRIRNGLG